MNKISKLFLLCILVFISITDLSSQNNSFWKFGLETGINYSNSSEDTAPLKKERPILPRIGLSINYSLTKHFGVESGLFYGQKGLKSKGTEGPIMATVKLHQDVISIPLMATYKISISNSKFGLGSGIGAYFAYGIGGKIRARGVAFGQEIDKEFNTFDNILKKQDFGLNCKIFTEYDQFVLNLGYEFGLINIGKSNVVGKNLDYKNRIISATLGYKFGFKNKDRR